MRYFKILRLASVFLIIYLVTLPAISSSEEIKTKKYGSLSVFSKVGYVKVYIDNDFVSETPVEIEKMQVGTHLVTATKDEEIVYEEIVEIKEGEVTTIVVTKKEKAPPPKEEKKKEEIPRDYGLRTQSGPYLKAGFISSNIISLNVYGPSYYASSLGFGGGYKFGLAPSVDLVLSLERGDFISGGDSWYIMPIMLSLNFSYSRIPGFGGKEYFSIGLGYFITNFRVLGEELSSIGYCVTPFGLEFPVGDAGIVFVETFTTYAENGKHKFALASFSIGGGYRWTF